MAQLIKLEDYISRYERNPYHYTSQFIRMKQDNWKKLHHIWLNGENTEDVTDDARDSVFSKWKWFLKRNLKNDEEVPEDKTDVPETEQNLKHHFLDRLFPLQLKWASSTVTKVSFMKQNYYDNDTLKYFLKRFPDTYLVMYYPIFNIKNAPVDGEVILISPIGIEIIYIIEESPDLTIMADDERTWMMKGSTEQTRLLSPMIALRRTEQLIKSILALEDITFPIKKVVLSRTNHITYHSEPLNTAIIGKLEYDAWFSEKRQLFSPLKNQQLKTADLLLKNCHTNSVNRPEWEDDDHTFTTEADE